MSRRENQAFHGSRGGLFRALLHRPLASAALAYLIGLVLACAAAPLIAPYNPEFENLTSVLSGPSLAHLLGTDDLGRDVLSRLLYGGRVSLLDSAEAVLAFALIGVPVGLVAGYRGGRIDRLVMSVTDIVLSIPVIIVLLVVAAVFTGDLPLMICLGIVASPSVVRVVRAATMSVRKELYVRAAEVVGLKRMQVLRRHILPQVMAPILVQVSVFAAAAIAIEAALGYLGLDVSPPAPSWGSMVAEAATVIDQQPFLMIPSGCIIALTVIALGIFGDAMRDVNASRRSSTVPPSQSVRATARLTARLSVAQVTGSSPDASAFPLATSKPLLSVRDLAVVLPAPDGELLVVDHVSFDLGRGESLGIVGESGCGKTMMALALLGLLPAGGRIVSGSVLFQGRQLVGMPSTERAKTRGREIGLISQEPMVALDPVFTVGSQMREVLRTHRGISHRSARAEALELLSQVRLPNPSAVADRFPHELSGGMAQRVCIALALAGRPLLLIADEPTTALDVTVQAEILDLLLSLREKSGMSILLVTHDWGVVADFCERTAVMYAGQVVELAAVSDMFNTPLHPYTEGLLAANPHLAGEGPLPSIAGTVPPPQEWPISCRFAPRCPYVTDDCGISPIPARVLRDGRITRCLHPERVGGRVTSADL